MIEAKQVRYGIRSREILRGVDFRVEKGEFVGLIGPNGSGKSTFLKNVYKVLRPQAGELTLMGDDLLAMSNREMAQRLGVSQDQYQEDLANSSMCNVLSLDALFEDREQTGRAELPDDGSEGRPEDSMLRQELLEILTKAIESLRENEQTVISLYYHKNLSMKEIAQVMEVSEPRISQLHSRAIQKLKLYMNQYMTGM